MLIIYESFISVSNHISSTVRCDQLLECAFFTSLVNERLK